jgi:hypothetical protein
MEITAAVHAAASQVQMDPLSQPKVVAPGAGEDGGRDLAADRARLEEALKGPDDTAKAEHPALEPADVTETQGPGTLADAILQGIRNARESYDQRVDMINKRVEDVGGKTPSISEVIKLQMDVMQLGMHQELTAKLSDKTSAGVQTLFRSQG